MTMIAIWGFVIAAFLIGFAGIFIPIIPGLPIIWGGILFYAMHTKFTDVTFTVVVVTFLLMILGIVIDVVAGVIGAKLFGASWYGVLGAVVGGVVGFMVANFFGFFIGMLCGVFVVEYFYHQKIKKAMHVSMGTIFGFIGNVVAQVVIACIMIGIFIISILHF